MDLIELSKQCALALKISDWPKLETLSRELLIKLQIDPDTQEKDLRRVAKSYLASIIGNGNFLKTSDPAGYEHFRSGAAEFRKIVKSSNEELVSILKPEIYHLAQIQLFLTKPQTDALNKASKSLRRLGRPHLAIDLTSAEIAKSRLNYYSLVVRGSAYVDLGLFAQGIKDGELALKHAPGDQKRFSLTLLSRAYLGQFKHNGLIEDGEVALDYALKSLDLKHDPYIARVFISLVHALGIDDYKDLISELNSKLSFNFDSSDPVAIEISESILQQSGPEGMIEEEDPWSSKNLEEDDGDWLSDSLDEEDSVSDYFEDYFEEFSESLHDPQSPHLEP